MRTSSHCSSDHSGLSPPPRSKWFPASNSGAEVRDRLVQACRKLGVQFAYGAGLEDLRRQQDGGWELLLQGGAREAAQRVILATGGLSYPSL